MKEEYKTYKKIFDAIKDTNDPDEVKAMMVKEGVPFQSVTRIYNQIMIKAGRAFTPTGRQLIVETICNGRGIKTRKSFQSRVAAVAVALKGTVTERGAAVLVRNYASEAGLKVYKTPERNSAPRISFMKQFCDFLEANPLVGEKDVMKYLNRGTAKYVKRNINLYMDIYRMAQSIVRNSDNG